MRLALPVLLSCLLLAATGERNLVRNGSFEEGPAKATKIPGWSEVDGLTTFFTREPGRGRVLLIDTDVLLSEANRRWKEMAEPTGTRPPAREKSPTKEPKYDTVGGTTGAKIYSDYFRVEPGMRYRLRVDVKSDAPTVKIFVKGYAKFEGGFRKFYQCYKNIKPATGKWRTWERTFHPTARSPKVTHIRIMPYAYWPPGKAWIDNVSVTRVGKEDPEAPAAGGNLLRNGDFEARGGPGWSAEGDAGFLSRGSLGTCGRLAGKGVLVSAAVPVAEGREYRLTGKIRTESALLKARVEGLVVLGGKRHVLYTSEEVLAGFGEEWQPLECRFHPTRETPQVAFVRVRFELEGGKGSALVDDVSIELCPEKPESER